MILDGCGGVEGDDEELELQYSASQQPASAPNFDKVFSGSADLKFPSLSASKLATNIQNLDIIQSSALSPA